jgi:hypothetical protein
MATRLTEHQFHAVWTEAVGKPGYDKKLFQEVLSSLIEKGIVIPTEEIKSMCTCQGFYRPINCPIHGINGIAK